MSGPIEVKVPDIGGYDDVPVIEVLVAVGDTVKVDQGLVTLESDKATMEVPSSVAGVVRELKVKVGDTLSEGSVVAVIEADAAGSAPSPARAGEGRDGGKPASTGSPSRESKAPPSQPSPAAQGKEPQAPAPQASAATGRKADIECQLVVLGAGPGGYTAAFRAADLGMDVVLVERYPQLGGVCLNVGCIPSKALLHAAAVDRRSRARGGLRHRLRHSRRSRSTSCARYKDKVVGQLTKGLATMAKQRKVRVVAGSGRFVSANELEVQGDKGTQLLRFEQCIIAAGSQAVKLPGFPWDDPRVMDSTDALELAEIPKRLLVVGGGIIGLEMATVYPRARLAGDGRRTRGPADAGRRPRPRQAAGRPPEEAGRRRAPEDEGRRGQGAEGRHRLQLRRRETFPRRNVFDRVLVAVGRTPNGGKLDAGKAGVQVSERGFIAVDRQMRTNVPHIFAIGDLVGQPMLAHKATHEGRLAAEVAAGREARMGRARDSVGRLHRSGNRLGRRHRNRSEGEGTAGRRRQVPVGGERPRDRHRPHRRLHQAAVRRRRRIASSAPASSACTRAT